ncbi:flagellar biosynthetic protein FliR [Methylotenera sp. N17]|uniref:flagellar biosynthetic protein FliR n=1 Tax=Methylotenera sp. N17 TaxID=1502761 RepID=UPI000647E1CE|nr:flagellar biosynthetic protein FliR [Methylotenera sp. N17]
MVTISSDLLQAWIVGLLWPLTRILGFIAVAPILSHTAIPQRVRLGYGIVLTLAMMPAIPAMPALDIISFQGLLILVQQFMIGIAMGFAMRLVFVAIELAGHMIGMSMGLGFASFFDPQSEGQTTAVSQFLVLICLLVFLSLDGHLMFVSVLANSFTAMPIAVDGHGIDAMKIASWGETIFSSGLLLALPVVTALLITNMALGILTKTAPQLNIFGIGFPITISIGFIVLAVSLPTIVKPLEKMIDVGASHMLQITK